MHNAYSGELLPYGFTSVVCCVLVVSALAVQISSEIQKRERESARNYVTFPSELDDDYSLFSTLHILHTLTHALLIVQMNASV